MNVYIVKVKNPKEEADSWNFGKTKQPRKSVITGVGFRLELTHLKFKITYFNTHNHYIYLQLTNFKNNMSN